MRGLILAVLAASAAPAVLAQGPSPSGQTDAERLPVRRVILYKTGVGYFEHRTRVTGAQSLTVRFTSGQLDDVLKSLTALDLGNGRITGISYNSAAPLDRRLGALRLPVGQDATLTDLLGTLRGARVEVTAGGVTTVGRILSLERQTRRLGPGAVADVQLLSLVTDGGDLRTFEIEPSLRLRVLDRDLRDELGQYLDLVGAAREQDVRRMIIRTDGTGEREIFVSYVSEVPVWKTTYRLVLPREGSPFLQGWAVVDNTIGEDWTNVQLSLVAGAPQTFIQPISQPYYTRRPVIPLPETALLTPQTHGATLVEGLGTLAGRVVDATGARLPGVTVTATGGAVTESRVTNAAGTYSLRLPPGVYRIGFELAGFKRATVNKVQIAGGVSVQQDVTLQVGTESETVTVTANQPSMTLRASGAGAGAGTGAGAGGGRYAPSAPAPPPPPAAPLADVLRQARPGTTTSDLGDLFEYRISTPVTIAKNESALVPILSADVEAEKVSLWNTTSGRPRPVRAVWLKNSSGLTLDSGSFSVVEGDAFAGEGLIEALQPGERRLLSYAADLAVVVSKDEKPSPQRIVRLRARAGTIVQETEARTVAIYRIRNEDTEPRNVVIEHAVRAGWTLREGVEPVERSADVYRFRVSVPSKEERTLDVSEDWAGRTQFSIGTFDETQVQMWIDGGLSSVDLERALKPLIDKRRQVASLVARLEALHADRQRIFDDQQRVRENMKALGRSDEELRALLARYTAQLGQQEDRLATLQQEMTRANEDRERAERELADLIGTLDFEVTAPR